MAGDACRGGRVEDILTNPPAPHTATLVAAIPTFAAPD